MGKFEKIEKEVLNTLESRQRLFIGKKGVSRTLARKMSKSGLVWVIGAEISITQKGIEKVEKNS